MNVPVTLGYQKFSLVSSKLKICVCFKALLSPPSQGPGSSGIPGVGELCSIFFHFPSPPFLVFSCSRLGSRKGDREKTGPSAQGEQKSWRAGGASPILIN